MKSILGAVKSFCLKQTGFLCFASQNLLGIGVIVFTHPLNHSVYSSGSGLAHEDRSCKGKHKRRETVDQIRQTFRYYY